MSRIQFSESPLVSEDQPVYTEKEWREFLRGWRGETVQQARQRASRECRVGVKREDICSVEYPCWSEMPGRCYDLEGDGWVLPSEKAGRKTQQARDQIARRKQWQRFMASESDMRGSHDFDQMMDRKALVRHQQRQRPGALRA